MHGPRLATVVVVALAALLVAYVSDGSGAATKTIATASTSDFRVALTATNLGGGGGAPEARVTLTTSRKTDGGWRRTGVHRLPGTYFWKTVTGPLAVCLLDLRTTGAPRVLVRMLQSPSLGCGPQATFRLTR